MKILTGIPVYNEGNKIKRTLTKIPVIPNHKVVVVDDGSTDNTARHIQEAIKENDRVDFHIITHKRNKGVGHSMKDTIHYAIKHNYHIYTTMSGNGKDNPPDLKKLIHTIVNQRLDYVQGSRFLKGGSYQNLPLARMMLIKLFTILMNLLTGFRGTDATNGFRAYRLSHLKYYKKSGINVNQKWLDTYELEIYIHYKFMTGGFRVKEIAVSKNYLPNVKNYSKITPFVDWWKIARTILYLTFGLKD